MANFHDLTKRWDSEIRAGQRAKVRSELQQLPLREIPRSHAVEVANLCRRVGLHLLGFRIMSPIVRPEVPVDPPTSREWAMYAALLIKLGAIDEALGVLKSAPEKIPDILLYTGFAHIGRWDYDAAIYWLRRYIRADAITDYERMIGQVNLAASYVYTDRHAEAQELLAEIRETTAARGWNLFRANSLELSAVEAFSRRDWSESTRFLSMAEQSSHDGFGDMLTVRKWRAILAVSENSPTQESLQRLLEVRAEAAQQREWEIVRDCDYHQAKCTRDKALMARVYFGTPYAKYRTKTSSSASDWFEIPDRFTWQMTSLPSLRVYDLELGRENGGALELRRGGALHRALAALALDFYRPITLGMIHSLIYPGEYFNSYTSPRRVARLIDRLREEFAKAEVPLRIDAKASSFKLEASPAYAIFVEKRRPLESRAEFAHREMLSDLKSAHPYRAFSSDAAARTLGISVSAARTLLKQACEEKKLHRIGAGRGTLYKFAK